jgi:hypothetical protein
MSPFSGNSVNCWTEYSQLYKRKKLPKMLVKKQMQVIYFNIEIVEILLTVYRINLNSRGSVVKY